VHANTILLDLDGTLVDSAAGILNSLREALGELGIPWSDSTFGLPLVGPPMYETLPPLIGEEATRAVVPLYRRIYADHGYLACTPYPGVAELLGELAGSAQRIALATSKAEAAARQILDHQGWTSMFAAVVGDTPDAGRPTKAAVIAEAVRQLGAAPDGTVMVGDRGHDVVGARENGLPCIGAGWGYGQPGELTRAGATAVYDTVADLATALGNGV